MNYQGKLYGKAAGMYFDTGHTAQDWDQMEQEIQDLKSDIKALVLIEDLEESMDVRIKWKEKLKSK